MADKLGKKLDDIETKLGGSEFTPDVNDKLGSHLDYIESLIEGGSGGSEVVANPEEDATEDLNKLKVEDVTYAIPNGLPDTAGSVEGQVLKLNSELNPTWSYDSDSELPSTEGASEGDVLKIGQSGLEWGSSGGIDTDVTVEIETTASDDYANRTNYATAISLQQFIANCEAGNVYTEGTIAKINNLISGKAFRLLLIGTNHEVLAYDDTTKAKTTWQFLDTPQHNVYLGLSFNVLDWVQGSGRSSLMDYLNGINEGAMQFYPSNMDGLIAAQELLKTCHTIYESLPDTLKRHIKTVRRYYYRRRNRMSVDPTGGGEKNYDEKCQLACNVFHLARTDLDGSEQGRITSEGSGSQYNYFNANARRIRFYNGSATHWWTASPHNSYCYIWYFTGNTGIVTTDSTSTSFGIAPAFCI